MTVSVLFDIQDTDPDSALSKLLREIKAEMPEHTVEHERLVGQLMILRGTQMLEAAAIREHDDRMNKSRRERAAATRAARAVQ